MATTSKNNTSLPSLFPSEDIVVDSLSDDALQGLISMKYDPDDLNCQAHNYKDEGNLHFKRGKYDLAVENYTAGIKLNAGDKEINAALYFNRGMAHFKRGNYRTALTDFDFANKYSTPYFKAIAKAAECCLHLKRFDDCLSWCKTGLEIEPENKILIATRDKCKAGKEAAEIAEQKKIAAARRAEMENEALMTALKSHGVHFHPLTVFTVDWFQTHCPQGTSPKFVSSTTDQSAITWPVVLSYPEIKKQDFIEAFNEQNSFLQVLETVLGADAQRFDLDPAYKPNDVVIFYENPFKRKLVQVDPSTSLLSVLRRGDYIILDGTPNFVVLCKHRPDSISLFTKAYDTVEYLPKK